MSIATIYGINGVGKDTVALEIAKQDSTVQLTSESRALMYIMGISTEYDARAKISREQYQELENTPQARMRRVTETDYRGFVDDLRAKQHRTIMLSHLVFALYLDKETTYLTDKDVPEWYIGLNDAFVQLVAPAETLYKRRTKDQAIRDRGNFSIDDIETHQRLCDAQWTRLSGYAAGLAIPTVTISNTQLESAVTQVQEVLASVSL